MPMRVKILAPQAGPEIHAEVGEERTVHQALGQQLIAARHAELIAKAWPPAAAKAPAKSASAKLAAPKSRARKR